jgi:NADP-dependent 3-hydroxy acid dehydrogenase YdfG
VSDRSNISLIVPYSVCRAISAGTSPGAETNAFQSRPREPHSGLRKRSSCCSKNKVAIVTGGNSGIGQAIVLELARQGASVVIDYVSNPEATNAMEKQITGLGERAFGVDADVSQVAELQKLIDTTVEKFGRVDVMVNNAGVETRTSILDTTEAQYDKVLNINLKTPSSALRLPPGRC